MGRDDRAAAPRSTADAMPARWGRPVPSRPVRPGSTAAEVFTGGSVPLVRSPRTAAESWSVRTLRRTCRDTGIGRAPGLGGSRHTVSAVTTSRTFIHSGALGPAVAASPEPEAWPNCVSPWPRSTPLSATSPATAPWSSETTPPRRHGRRGSRGLPGDDADRLPDRGPGAAASLPAGARDRATAGRWPSDLDAAGLGGLRRGRAATSPRGRQPTRIGARATSRTTPRPCCTAGAVVADYAKHHLPNYGVFDEQRYFVPGTRPACDPGRRRRRRAGDLRGHLGQAAGRWRWSRGGRAPGCCWSSTAPRTSATRTTCGCSCARARARERRLHAGVRQHGRRARTSWSSTATRWSWTPTARCWPGRRSSSTICWSSTSPAAGRAAHRPARRRTVVDLAPVPARRPSLGTCPARSPRRSATRARCTWRWCIGLRDYVRKNGFASVVLGMSGGHRLGAGRGDRLRRARRRARPRRARCRSQYSSRALAWTMPRDSAARTGAATSARCRSTPWSTRFTTAASRADRPGRGEPAGAGPRRHPDGDLQRGGPPGAGHRQQERARRRLLDDLRRRGRRFRPDQGRAQDAGLGAGRWRNGGPRRPARPRRSPSNSIDETADRRAAAGPAGQRLAARLRPARRHARRLRRAATGPRTSSSPRGSTPRWWSGCCG